MGLTPLGPGLDGLGCTSLLSYNVVMISRLCSWAVDDASRIIRFSDNVAWLKKYVPEQTEGLKIRGNRVSNVGGIIFPPGWNRVNWSAKIWRRKCHPAPRFRRPRVLAAAISRTAVHTYVDPSWGLLPSRLDFTVRDFTAICFAA